jgi:hypothetical protein
MPILSNKSSHVTFLLLTIMLFTNTLSRLNGWLARKHAHFEL